MMKTIFDKNTREELVARIHALNDGCVAQWGKMNVHQMVQHCIHSDDMTQGKLLIKRGLAGKLFGRMVLKSVLKDDAPFRKNSPTAKELMVEPGSSNLAEQKAEWQERVRSYERFSNDAFVHPFFGSMTREQTGVLVYKHYDHHLRQFGV